MTKVFVSYRRSDTDSDAGRIADRLVEAFGEQNVFHDHEALVAGVPWQQQIDAALAGTQVTLVVIGPHWLAAALADGSPRLHDAKDMVAYEIARSIELSIRIVPVLVNDALMPQPEQLPARLKALPGYQGRRLRNDSFGPDIERLITEVRGRRWPARRSAAAIAGLALAVLAGALWWLHGGGPDGGNGRQAQATEPAKTDAKTDAMPELRAGTLGLRITLDPPPDAATVEPHRFLLSVNEPVRIAKAELPPPRPGTAATVEVLVEDTLLPGRGERYEADVRRQPLSSALSTAGNLGRTSVCLTRTAKAPASGLRALVDCVEGERCTGAQDNPGHFEVCGKRVAAAAPSWPWISSAHAAAGSTASWVVPSIETLQRQRQAGQGPAYTEVLLQTGPLPQLAAAREVSVQVAVNGRSALIDGLPPDASAVPFDAATGLRLRFALENLDFAGADQGHDDVALELRFLSGKTLVSTSQARLKYIALRSQPQPAAVQDNALGLRWTALYHPGRDADRFQIFINSSPDVAALVAAKKAFDAAGFSVGTAGAARRLVAVVRPPLGDSKAWGLNVAELQPSGQLRFTFDDAASARLCRALDALATGGDRRVRADSYRRSVDDTRQYKTCRSF